MRVTIEEISREQEEEIILRCHQVDANLWKMVSRIKALQTGIVGFRGDEIHRLTIDDIYYFEVVDSKSFFYFREAVFESRLKLFVFEEICQGTAFFRASKSLILNADKIDFVSPSFSGRFAVTLLNQETVVVSRQYVSVLKKRMGL